MVTKISRKAILVWLCVTPLLLLALYILSILWRCSVAEQRLYGRSRLIPLARQKPVENELGTARSFFDNTYSFTQKDKTVHVNKQLVNSFQHAYGSALASYELGSFPADLLFRANEYVEAIVCSGSGSLNFYLDSKKDLFNNAAGRIIGQRARTIGLNGAVADDFMVDEILRGLESGAILNHWRDNRVVNLPSFGAYGCPGVLEIMTVRTRQNEMSLKQLGHR